MQHDFLPPERSVDNVRSKDLQDLVRVILRMDVQFDGLGKIQTEDAHDRFGVDHISAGYEIKIEVIFGNIIYKSFDFVNRVK